MTNLAQKPPLGFKRPRLSKADGRRYMALVAALPCVICGYWPVEVHHVIHGRYSTRKSSDLQTIPLCHKHHAELHAGKETWARKYGEDHEYLAVVADALAGELNP